MFRVHSNFSSTENEKLPLKPLSLQIRTQNKHSSFHINLLHLKQMCFIYSVTFLVASAKHRLLNSFVHETLKDQFSMVISFAAILNPGSVLSGSCIGLTGEGSQRLNVPGWMDNKEKLWSLKILAGQQVFLLIIWTMIGSIGAILKKILLNPWDLMGQTGL